MASFIHARCFYFYFYKSFEVSADSFDMFLKSYRYAHQSMHFILVEAYNDQIHPSNNYYKNFENT